MDGELYESSRVQGAAEPVEIGAAIDYWLSLEGEQSGAIETPAGTARFSVLPVPGQPDGVLVVANFPASKRGEIDEAVRTVAAVGIGILLMGSLLAVVLAGRILKPLRRLAATALRIQDTNLSERSPVTSRGEASEIPSAFNAMLERLQGAFTGQRQFLDNAIHELRSPMTVIRGHVELLTLDDTPEARDATVTLVLDEIDRASALIGDLALLARAEDPGFVQRNLVAVRQLVIDVHRKCTAPGRATADRPAALPASRHGR